MRGIHAAMALALAGLMLAEGGPAGGHLAGSGGVRSVQRLRGGQEEKNQKVGRKVIPWQHRIKDIFGVHKLVVKGVPYNKRGFGTNITEDSFFIPKGPKMNRVANTPKRFRLNTIFKNMTHCAQSREDPGGMDELTGTHVPTVEVAAGGIKVSCGEVRGEEEKGLHYVEYLWLMTEDGSKVLGHAVKGPKDGHSHEFVTNEFVEGDVVHKVVPYMACNKHGAWKGEAFELPANAVAAAKAEQAAGAEKRQSKCDKKAEWVAAHPRKSRGGKAEAVMTD